MRDVMKNMGRSGMLSRMANGLSNLPGMGGDSDIPGMGNMLGSSMPMSTFHAPQKELSSAQKKKNKDKRKQQKQSRKKSRSTASQE